MSQSQAIPFEPAEMIAKDLFLTLFCSLLLLTTLLALKYLLGNHVFVLLCPRCCGSHTGSSEKTRLLASPLVSASLPEKVYNFSLSDDHHQAELQSHFSLL